MREGWEVWMKTRVVAFPVLKMPDASAERCASGQSVVRNLKFNITTAVM